MDTVNRKQFAKMLAEQARTQRIPLHGKFELTPVCNLNCQMCYVHLPENAIKQRMLSGNQWIALMDDAISAGMLYALLTGGEAMTHPDFWLIYEHLKHNGVRVQLKSNGVLICGDNLNRIRELPPDALDISLYGCNGDSYSAVTGRNVFDKVTDNIRAVLDAGIKVRIMVTPSRAMLPWLEETFRLAKTFGVPVLVNEMLTAPREETGRELDDFGLTVEEYCDVRRISLEILQTEPQQLDDEPIWQRDYRVPISEKGLACAAGRSTFAVRWEGQMVPCLGLPEKLMEIDPKRVGFNKAWQWIGRVVDEYAIPKECLVCDLKPACRYCPTFHGKDAIHHQCNKEYCRYAHLRKQI